MIPEDAIEEVAHLVWKEGHYSTPWAEWKDKERWRLVAREILQLAAPSMLAAAWCDGAVAGWKQSGEGFNAEYPDESTGGCSVDLSGNPYKSGPGAAMAGLAAKLDAIRELHAEDIFRGHLSNGCRTCGNVGDVGYPCPTMMALDATP